MKHIARLRYDAPLIRKAISAFWWKRIGKKAAIWIPLSTAIAISIISRGNLFWVAVVPMTVLVVVSLLLVALYFAHKEHALDKLHTMAEPTAEIRVDEDSFSITSELGARKLNWSALHDLWKFDNFWLLFFAEADFVTLPLASIPIGMRNFISEQVQAQKARALTNRSPLVASGKLSSKHKLNRKNLLLAFPILSFLWFASSITIAGHFYPCYSHVTQFISELGATGSPHGNYVNYFGFIPTELFILGFVFTSYSVLPNTKMNLAGLLFIAIYGVTLGVAAFFPCDYECKPIEPTLSHNIHIFSAFPGYFCGIASIFVISSGSTLWNPSKLFKVISFCVGILSIFTFVKLDPSASNVGVFQRILELLMYSWFIYLGYSLRKYSSNE